MNHDWNGWTSTVDGTVGTCMREHCDCKVLVPSRGKRKYSVGKSTWRNERPDCKGGKVVVDK